MEKKSVDDMKRLRLSYPLYMRCKPSNAEAPIGYLEVASEIFINEVLVGKAIDGNSVWYKATDGNYYWSGGFNEIEFCFDGYLISTLDPRAQMKVLAEAIEYCWMRYKDLQGLTGIFVGEKFTGDTVTVKASLVFQVQHKKDVTRKEQIPTTILFKGFAIPTDVISVQFAVFDAKTAVAPGDTCSRINVLDVWGSVGVKVKRKEAGNEFHYFLTNYHVAANNLIASQVFSYRFPQQLGGRQMVVPSQFSDPSNLEFIGALHEGVFSSFHDTALILLGDPSSCNNVLPDGSVISGALDVTNDPSFVGQLATIYGAINKGKQRKIRSVNSSQFFSVPGHVHEMKQLIQIEKFSQSGDSGSAIMIGDRIIGLHVGSDDLFSYAIPIIRILKFFNLEIA